MAVDVGLLAGIPLFTLLDDRERGTLVGMLREVDLAEGAELYRRGDPGDALYLVVEGRISASVQDDAGSEIALGEHGPGDSLGELSLLDGGPRTNDARAAEPTRLLILDRKALVDLIARHPHAALDLLATVGRRLREVDAIVRSHVVRNLNEEVEERLSFGQRVADKVAEFGGSWGFILTFGGVLIGWIGLNLAMALRAFDPYPFILLNLVLSALAALQAPVIMMSQNRQAAKDRLRSDLDYEIDRKAELEIAHLHRKVDDLRDDLRAHIGRAAAPSNADKCH